MNGCLQPTYGIIIGKIVTIFDPAIKDEEKSELIREIFLLISLLTLATFFTSYGGFSLMQISAEKLSFKLRARYFAALMKQEVAYFETQQIEALPSKMAEYFTHIADGSGEKFG